MTCGAIWAARPVSTPASSARSQKGRLARLANSCTQRLKLAATQPGSYDIVLRVGGDETIKTLHVGDEARPRAFQPERTTGLATVLWPAEDSLAGTGLERVSFVYPESDLGWLPGTGVLGVILVFLVASMAVGFLALKPLGVQI